MDLVPIDLVPIDLFDTPIYTSPTIYRCKLCEKFYLEQLHLNYHVLECHSSKSRRYICKVPACNRGFFRLNALRYHILCYHNAIGY